MKKYVFPILAALFLLLVGTVIIRTMLQSNEPNLWDATPLPTQPKTEREGKKPEAIVFSTYTSRELKFSMKVPKDWEVQKEGTGLYFLSVQTDKQDQVRENINVVREDLSGKNMTLEQYSEEALEQTKTLEEFRLVGSQDMEMNGVPGHTLVYIANIKGVPLKFQQAWIVTDDAAYVLTLATEEKTFPEYSNLFVRMANTLTIK